MSQEDIKAQSATQAMMGEVVVTGSRIPVTSEEKIAPVTSFSKAEIDRSAVDSIGMFLQALPYETGSALNTNSNNGGDGSVRVNLRGLGDQRNLILLNGQRMPNGGVGGDWSVDLNTIPVSMIERVEVMTSGASAVYGTDAITGVVNIITRKNFHGLEGSADYRITQQGDGATTKGRLLWGAADTWGHVSAGVEYVDQQEVFMAARAYADADYQLVDTDGTMITVGSATTPQGRVVVPAGNALGLAPGPYTLIDGTDGSGGAADWRPYVRFEDDYNFAPVNYLQTPSKRASLWTDASFELGESTRLIFEGMFSHRKSDQLLAASPYTANAQGFVPVSPSGFRGIPANNFYNPFGVDLADVRRRFTETGGRLFSQEVEQWRALLALQGGWHDWSWEVSAAYGRGDARNDQDGLLAASRMIPAVGPSGRDAAGNIVCGTPDPNTGIVAGADVIAGCVPVNLFSGQGVDGQGTLTTEMLGYVSLPVHDTGYNDQRFAQATVTGPWGKLPAGDIHWAAGIEYRREASGYHMDPIREEGVIGTHDTFLPGASFNTKEAYLEARLPIVNRLPALREVEVAVGARYSSYSSFDSNVSWQGGLLWRITDSFALRANYSQVFRAPSVYELYQTQADNETDEFELDPCGNAPTPEQQVNCAANGVPGGSYTPDPNGIYFVRTGGNPELDPEQGVSTSFGFTWAPGFVDGLLVEGSYWRVALNGAIDVMGHDLTLQQCADTGTPGVCANIQRLPNGQVSFVNDTEVNLGRYVTKGVDFNIQYTRDSSWGRWEPRLYGTYVDQLDIETSPGADVIQLDGNFLYGNVVPGWRGQASLDWRYGAIDASYALTYTGTYKECGDSFEFLPPDYCREIADVTYQDVSVGYTFDFGLSVQFKVLNLTDITPPFLNDGFSANTSVENYRLLGRTYYGSLEYSFR